MELRHFQPLPERLRGAALFRRAKIMNREVLNLQWDYCCFCSAYRKEPCDKAADKSESQGSHSYFNNSITKVFITSYLVLSHVLYKRKNTMTLKVLLFGLKDQEWHFSSKVNSSDILVIFL